MNARQAPTRSFSVAAKEKEKLVESDWFKMAGLAAAAALFSMLVMLFVWLGNRNAEAAEAAAEEAATTPTPEG
jgi:hypothetical protein